eukprot:TRINITY_DN13254_c0_g1_i1.p1 TRINITY_DN13254_c0_g1~~TRINITY_DN13254_c0_g1_i1.p1  ORF type:complete len:311 (+),score=75.66 TRINITY_DN13254_c0_g1_i1:930-1862(+)
MQRRSMGTAGKSFSSCLLKPSQFAEALSDIGSAALLEVGGIHSAIFERARILGARPLPTNPFIPASLKFVSDLDAKNATGVKPGAGIIEPAKFEWMMSVLGIQNQDEPLFLYDDTGMLSATRAWWVFHVYGHDNVYVLNGGFNAWVNDVSEDDPFPRRIEAGPFRPQDGANSNYKAKFDASKNVLIDELLELVGKHDVQIVDARPWEEFIGKNSRGNKHVGHIPEARFFDLSKVVQKGVIQSGDSASVKEIIEHSSLKTDKPTIVYCHSAVRATAAAMILKEAGFESVRVYEGSMSEWNNRDDTPKKHWD